jgi:alpha-beta hydrolase superfamily lysophospholipase
MNERAITFANEAGQELVGVWHEAREVSSAPAIVMLHGWTGYRTGPHQMLTRGARHLAAAGFSVLRFDFAGRGDSEGETELATLATMAQDTRAALAQVLRESGAQRASAPHASAPHASAPRALLLGLCSGCEIAFAAAHEPQVAGLMLWSAPVFAALPEETARADKSRHHLLEYGKKLLRPATYGKILSGRLDTKAIRKAVSGGGGAAHKIVESGEPGQLPAGWREAALRRFRTVSAPLLLVYGTGDPVTQTALPWYCSEYSGTPDVHLVEGANHSYYGLAWEREVFDATVAWLQDKKRENAL